MVDGRMAGTAAALGLSVVSSVSIVVCNKALMSTLGFVFGVGPCQNHAAAGGGGGRRATWPRVRCRASRPDGVPGTGDIITLLSLRSPLRRAPQPPVAPTGRLRPSPRSSFHRRSPRLALAYLGAIDHPLEPTSLAYFALKIPRTYLVCLHFAEILMKLFENKDLDPKTIIGFGILNGISIGLLNLSLGFNSIGFYQVTKLAIIPCTVSLETILFRKTFSTFLVIGKTSPVTYQVVGHLKTCIILGFGYVLFNNPFSWRNILGILLALLGMILYSFFCLMENKQKAPELSAPFFHTKVKGGEAGTLLLVQNGSAKVADGVVTEGPMWRSNRDLDA
ncbi:hypothetical protein OsI_04250 [Oryza sativa Indica Group]|uniref:Sugar phosphate transporter domain-containing protein n=1 Tax=Oryza sativa subsp. indica TaxID=39946 RepID=B8ABC9_ORYSI|nr:hypothetical protein OsI_04250 [Oryza sativa Indica Group]